MVSRHHVSNFEFIYKGIAGIIKAGDTLGDFIRQSQGNFSSSTREHTQQVFSCTLFPPKTAPTLILNKNDEGFWLLKLLFIIYLFVYLFIYSFIHSFIYLFSLLRNRIDEAMRGRKDPCFRQTASRTSKF